MGCRLYPVTKNPRSIERIVGVPIGTMDRLDKHYADRYSEDLPITEVNELWQRMNKDPDLRTLNCFMDEGWGRWEEIPGVDRVGPYGSIGECTDEKLVRELLAANQIVIDFKDLDGLGVCWS